jgi:cytosine/adenosine deaminase-related metal-dependent hydrolase
VSAVTLAAGWVVTGVDRPIRDGVVAVERGVITWVGPAGSREAPRGERQDLGAGVLLPGLVNAHTHLELSHLHRRVDPGGFVGWVERLVEARPRFDGADVSRRMAAAVEDLARTGTVAVGDVSNTLGSVAALAASPLLAVVFHELIGWDPSAADAVLEAAAARTEAVGGPRPAVNVEVRIAGHAPHSVSPRLFALMREQGGPAALHLAESPAETDFLRDGGGEWAAFLARRVGAVPFAGRGLSPVAYADALGLLRPGFVAVHCVHVDERDRRLLAGRRVSVVTCPRSNEALGVGRADVPSLLAAGLNVAVGTDSLASADTLDLMEDVRALSRQWPQLAPEVLLRMATENGARALGLPDLGRVAPRFRAALAFAPGPRDLDDPLRFLLTDEARPRAVFA